MISGITQKATSVLYTCILNHSNDLAERAPPLLISRCGMQRLLALFIKPCNKDLAEESSLAATCVMWFPTKLVVGPLAVVSYPNAIGAATSRCMSHYRAAYCRSMCFRKYC